MPSQRSLKSTQAFLGKIAPESIRCDYTLEDIPHNDEGLRILAANANWSSVALLAEQLGAEAIASGSGDTLQGLSFRLRYTLVQVTAYFNMQRYAAAKKLVDALGDLNSDRFIDSITNESIVPFSLQFISALLPSYCGAVMDSQRRLYNLLDLCRQRSEVTKSPIWINRIKRVQRALIVNHYQTEQYAEAIRLFEETIISEKYDDEKTEDFMVLRQMLHLQQFATLCLYCGNIFLAEDVFKAIEGLNTSDESSDIRQFHQFLISINQAIWLTFNDKMEEAAHIFREVARGSREFYHNFNQAVLPSIKVPTISIQRKSTSNTTKTQSALCQMAFHKMWVNAATSHVTCVPYETTRGKNPTSTMSNIIDIMEGYLKQDPVELLHSDAFLGNSVRLYTLEGDTRQKKVELLADMIEVFRCDQDSAPPLDKMM